MTTTEDKTTGFNAYSIAVAVVAVAAFVATLALAADGPFSFRREPILAGEAEFLITLHLWLFVWALLALVWLLLGFPCVKGVWNKESRRWTLALVLLGGPWLLIGQTLMARLPVLGAALTWSYWMTYAVAWPALVLSYLAVGVPLVYAVLSRSVRKQA